MVLLVMILEQERTNNNNINIYVTLKIHNMLYILSCCCLLPVAHDDKTFYEKFFKHALITMVLDALDEEPCTQKSS